MFRILLKVFVVTFVLETSFSITLPCIFEFDHKTGYTCNVKNFSNTNPSAHVTRVTGDHLYKGDKNHRNRSDVSVNRILIWNEVVHYLPGNLTAIFPHLRNLQVKKCGVKGLTRQIEFRQLRKMYFGFNDIAFIPGDYFWNFRQLEILSLFNNKVSDIPATAFRDLISLKRLTLNSNRIKKLDPDLLKRCTNLEYVDLGNNLLEHIDGGSFKGLQKLTQIFLHNNRIDSIGNDFLSSLPRLELAMMDGNKCINESFAKTSSALLEHIQSVFRNNCSPPYKQTTSSSAFKTVNSKN